MKVLFAVSSESISEQIIRRYQKEYKEILTYKNVYYFNAILKEIQKDKTYDRIVISEDLEPAATNNYSAMDKSIFEKLDSISDEAQDNDGKKTSIILICTDRRTRNSSLLVKLFSIGIYNALIENDRNIEQVCRLIKSPRTKKEAKSYYKIDSDDATYKSEKENEVNEVEIQNILTYFKKIAKNPEKFSDGFNNIASQYNDEQLRIIINCLPIKVKAVLEKESVKYREIMKNKLIYNNLAENSNDNNSQANKQIGIKINSIGNKDAQRMSKPIVIPSAINKAEKRKVIITSKNNENKNIIKPQRTIENSIKKEENKVVEPVIKKVAKPEIQIKKAVSNEQLHQNTKNIQERPKQPVVEPVIEKTEIENINLETKEEKRGRGRPRKYPVSTEVKPKGKRGRPRKIIENIEKEEIDEEIEELDLPIFEVNEEIENNVEVPVFEDEEDEIELPSFDVEEDDDELPIFEEEDDEVELSSFDDEDDEVELPSFEDEDDEVELPSFEDEDDEVELPSFDEEDDEVELPSFDEEDDEVELTSFDDEDDEVELPSFDDEDDEVELPSFDDEEDEVELPSFEDEEDEVELPSFDEEDDEVELSSFDEEDENPIITDFDNNEDISSNSEIPTIKSNIDYSMSSLNSLMTKDKKIVTFLGTSKNGTSFLVNNLAAIFDTMGINTAILDMTKNKNSYYIYTNNEEKLRKVAYKSLTSLKNGYAEGIKVGKNLTVYTALPNDGNDYSNAESILSTLVQNHSLILIDCDFTTDPSYFASCQEIYLVQSMDILTIQPLTMFLRDLKTKGALDSEKVRVVINKELRMRALTSKMVIAGLSFYNDPAMSFMTDLFNKDLVKACTIPFDENVYSKYLDGMVDCRVSLSGYSKNFISKLKVLAEMVYPRMPQSTYDPNRRNNNFGNNKFSDNMNNTLEQMRKKY